MWARVWACLIVNVGGMRHSHCLQLVPKASRWATCSRCSSAMQAWATLMLFCSNIECRSGSNLHPICLLKDKSSSCKLAFFSSWRRISCPFVHSLAVYCAKAVLVGSTLTMWKQTKKSANLYLQGLVGGTIILAQYLWIAPIVIPTLLAQYCSIGRVNCRRFF